MDFDLHGIVGVRLVGASPTDAAAVRAQLGAAVRPLGRDPDIVVRFVSHVPVPGLCYVELGRNGFTDDGFFILAHGRQPVRVRFPFDAVDTRGEIVCQHGVRSVPFLDALVKLAALRKGHVPVHASGFAIDGAGVVVAGWAHGGKTSCLLAFARAGATFIADDMVLLSGDGRQMHGVSTPLSVSDWQLEQLPQVSGGQTRRLLATAVRSLQQRAAGTNGSAAAGLLRAGLAAAQRRLKVNVAPETVFRRVATSAVEPRTVLLSFSHASDEIQVVPADPDTVAAQLATLLRFELLPCYEQYLAYRFANPAVTYDWLERAEQEAFTLLRYALVDKRVFIVRHPHPVSLSELYRALSPVVRLRPSAPPSLPAVDLLLPAQGAPAAGATIRS